MSFDFSAFMNNNFLSQMFQSSAGSSFGSMFGNNSLTGGNFFAGGSYGNTYGSSYGNSFGASIFNSTMMGGTRSVGYSNYNTTNNNGIYNRNGYNVAYNQAGRIKAQQSTAIALSILSMVMPAAVSFIQNLITALVNQKAGEIEKQNPTQKSAVANGTKQEAVSKEKSQLQDAIAKDKATLAQLDQAGGKDALANLEKTAMGEQYKDVKLNGNNTKNVELLNKLAGTFSSISPDFSSLNSQLKNNITIESTEKFPDNISEASNFGDISKHHADLQNYSANLDTFIANIENLSIDVDDIDFENDSEFQRINNDYKNMLTEDSPNKNEALQKKKEDIEKYKNYKLEQCQKALEDIKKQALEEANCQKEDLGYYEDILNQLEMDIDSLPADKKDALEAKLQDGTLTFDELLTTSCDEADAANKQLAELANQKGDVSAAYTEAEERIAKNTDKLKLLEVANSKVKDLGNGSDMSRNQARLLQQKAQQLYENGGTFEELQAFAKANNIPLAQDNKSKTSTTTNTNTTTNTPTNISAPGSFSITPDTSTPPKMGVGSNTSVNINDVLGFKPTEYKTAQEVLFPKAQTVKTTSGETATTSNTYVDTTKPTGEAYYIFDNENNKDGTSIVMTADGQYILGGLDHIQDTSKTYLNRIGETTFFSPSTGGFIDSQGLRIVDVSEDMISQAGFKAVPNQDNVYQDADGQKYILDNGFLEKYQES